LSVSLLTEKSNCTKAYLASPLVTNKKFYHFVTCSRNRTGWWRCRPCGGTRRRPCPSPRLSPWRTGTCR